MPEHTDASSALHAHNRAASTVLGALGSEIRISILALLIEREYLVSELVTQLHRPQPLISQHLRVLKNAGIVVSHPQGRSRCYRLRTPELSDLFREIISLAATAHQYLPPATSAHTATQSDVD
ncbi:ArsR/SmtB family transcription factor [Corynebacterium lowii]|uniref:HTH-type transcriptional repressor SmtB n=1 Tax=Corynebacterium lowii TaxID=1544413 RepID=A0A0Q1AJ83_9CORY|nr:metalloregulator ArsR/SmtB family transcription factor [Corynebacterium lowii]KQB86859.1 HTH-type transcriptional repressor SmtB [Corynebacterium lowii]MDP9851547.1 ArsR family transcriptional regulator [Corynebacterium lowii]